MRAESVMLGNTLISNLLQSQYHSAIQASWSNFASIEWLDIQVPMKSSICPILKYNRFIPSCIREYISQNTSRYPRIYQSRHQQKKVPKTKATWQHLIEAIPPLLHQASQSQEALNLLKGECPAAFLPFGLLMITLLHMVSWRNVVKYSEMQRNAETCRKMQ